MDDILIVKNKDGINIKIKVLNIIESTDSATDYIIFKTEGIDEIFASKLIENEDSYSLEDIDVSEKSLIETYLSENNGE